VRKRFLALASILAIVAACDSSTAPSIEAPVLQSVSPERGTVGTEVRISGSGFTEDNTQVFFGDAEALSVELEAGALFAVAPDGLVAGEFYDVRVVNHPGASAMLQAAFEAVEPRASRVNGVTRPSGLKGMTVIVEGDAFGDRAEFGAVYFAGADGSPIAGAIADPANDWTNSFVVTSVPQEVGDTSWIWVETATGASDSIQFTLIQTAGFSPAVINWTRTTDLPRALQGLGAVFVPVEDGPNPGQWVYTAGGADESVIATDVVYRAPIEPDGSAGEWDVGLPPLPEPRAYHALVGATAYTAALDTATTAAYLYALGGLDAEGEVVSTIYSAHIGLDGQVGGWQLAGSRPQPLHSAGAVVFRGYIYVAGGADAEHQATAAVYRARVNADGSLGSWESLPSMAEPRAYFSLVSFGPYLYAVGGERETAAPAEGLSGTESNTVEMARINLRTGELREAWSPAGNGATTPKRRSKHSTVFAGGYLFTTSGLYSGQAAGSSENVYAAIGDGGALGSWNGATGVNTIYNRLGYSLYTQAAISFVDAEGNGHVLVLGGARVENPGEPSEAVVYY
jgi:hypothetical protein